MSGLKELRKRIQAVKSTQKITSAMKMIAASRLHRVQTLSQQNKIYDLNLENSLRRVIFALKQEENQKNIKYITPKLLQNKTKPQNYLLYVFSSQRGLCGAYNVNIARQATRRIKELLKQNKNIKVICLGKKAYEILCRTFVAQNLDIQLFNEEQNLSYSQTAALLAQEILQGFKSEEFDICEFIYARFTSALNHDFICEKVCPLTIESLPEDEKLLINGDAFYDYMPDKINFLAQILPLYFANNILKIILSSEASEHSTRMTSMDNATRNAQKIVGELTLKYNSLRQSAITTELIEVIAGAEAV